MPANPVAQQLAQLMALIQASKQGMGQQQPLGALSGQPNQAQMPGLGQQLIKPQQPQQMPMLGMNQPAPLALPNADPSGNQPSPGGLVDPFAGGLGG